MYGVLLLKNFEELFLFLLLLRIGFFVSVVISLCVIFIIP